MALDSVTQGGPHVAAHNAERAAINALQNLSDPELRAKVIAQVHTDTSRIRLHPLARFHAALAIRNRRPVRIVTLGSSTTWGAAASSREREWTSILLRAFQAAYPSGIPGGEASVKKFSEAAIPNPLPGVQLINGGISATTSANYISGLTLMGIANADPDCVMHMIGSNDSVMDVSPTQFQSNLIAHLNSIDNQQNAAGHPTCHILLHTYRRWQATAEYWSEYYEALKAIEQSRDNVLLINLDPQFEKIDMYGADPYDFMSPDTVHMTDSGHALMADLIIRSLGISPAPEDRRVVLSDSYTKQVGVPQVVEMPAGRSYEMFPANSFSSGNGRLTHSAGGTILVDSGLSDLEVSGVVNTGDGGSLAGLLFRGDSDTNRLGVFINRVTQQVALYKADSGATTILSETSFASSVNTSYVLSVIAQGPTIKVYVDAKLVMTVELSPADQTKFGVFTKIGFRSGAPTSNLYYQGLLAKRL